MVLLVKRLFVFARVAHTYTDGRILVVVAVQLTDDLGRAGHPVPRVGQAVILDHSSSDGRIGRQAEPAVVDDGRFQTVDGCMSNNHLSSSLRKPSLLTRANLGLTFTSRWRPIPSSIDVTNQVSSANQLISFRTRIGNHAEVVTRIVDQLVATVDYACR